MIALVFTGPSSLSRPQEDYLLRALPTVPCEGTVWVVGTCIGVDALVARYGYAHGAHVIAVVPADRSKVDPQWADYCHEADEMPVGTGYRYRNARMIWWARQGESPSIVAVLRRPTFYRSGEWMTLHLARAVPLPERRIILPSEVYR